jgi:hypothetical protein
MIGERLPIFDPLRRSDKTPSSRLEPRFNFLNRIAGEYWERPRRLVQAWSTGSHRRWTTTSFDNGSVRATTISSEAPSWSFTHERLLPAGGPPYPASSTCSALVNGSPAGDRAAPHDATPPAAMTRPTC